MTVGAGYIYDGLRLDADFGRATRDDDTTIRFSRAERQLLSTFHASPGALLTRDQLLDAAAGIGSESRDRNIDFLIYRLRRKLGDRAKASRFVETRYGEGYVWIAQTRKPADSAAGAFIVVGPVNARFQSGAGEALADGFARGLAAELRLVVASENRVAIDKNCPPPDQFGGNPPEFSIELSFLDFSTGLECAIVLRHFASGQIIGFVRVTLDAHETDGDPERAAVQPVARTIQQAIWDRFTYRDRDLSAPTHAPLPVRMFSASRMMGFKDPWSETQARLRESLKTTPGDPQTQIMLATTLHSRYITDGIILPGTDGRADDEDEIESLVRAGLPYVQDDPVFALTAAKLLYFVDRGFRPMAIDLASTAFDASTAFGMSCAIMGQIRMYMGELDAATDLFEQGLSLCANDRDFEQYLLILACEARMAAGDAEGLAAIAERTYATHADLRPNLSAVFTLDGVTGVHPGSHEIYRAVPVERMRGVLVWHNYICARLFIDPAHGANALRGLLSFCYAHFGDAVIADEVWTDHPALCAEIAGASAAAGRAPVRSAPRATEPAT